GWGKGGGEGGGGGGGGGRGGGGGQCGRCRAAAGRRRRRPAMSGRVFQAGPPRGGRRAANGALQASCTLFPQIRPTRALGELLVPSLRGAGIPDPILGELLRSFHRRLLGEGVDNCLPCESHADVQGMIVG